MRAHALPVLLGLAASLLASPALADGEDPIDVAPFRDKLKVYVDGKGHALVAHKAERRLWYCADDKDCYEQRVIGYGEDGGAKTFSYSFWEPRVLERWRATFAREGEKKLYRIQCADRTTEVQPLADADATALLDKVKLHPPRWKRLPYALARDDKGNYFFVDRERDSAVKRDFKLYQGPIGRLKPLKMKNVVSDSEGDIFSTVKGDLRLILDKDDAAWVRGRKRVPLKIIPVEDNGRMIYTELGVYAGQALGTPCDDL